MSEEREPRGPLRLREAVNVDDLMQRDELVRRMKRIREGVVLDKATYEYWNRLHPNEPPLDTTFEDKVIAWCDGKGPMPDPPAPSSSESQR